MLTEHWKLPPPDVTKEKKSEGAGKTVRFNLLDLL